MKPRIIHEDRQIIVCHKPAGIPVQSRSISTADMVSILKNHLAEERPASSEKTASRRKPPYLAVIHRLDQPVEGLLVFAKTPEAAKDLNRQLTSSGFGKYYRAEVCGVPAPPEGDLEDYLVKDGRTNTSRVCLKETPGAKAARLHYRVTETRNVGNDVHPDVHSIVEIRLDTGRHHQIRVQMAHLGYPLAGDRKYGSKESAGPLKLCAYRLEFLHPSDHRPMRFELP